MFINITQVIQVDYSALNQNCCEKESKVYEHFPSPERDTLNAGKSRLKMMTIRGVKWDSPIMEFVSVVVGGNDVQEEDVLSFVVQPAQPELHLGEHLPGRKRRV